MQKKTVAVLFGGVSSEHDVSRISVTSVLRHLDPEKYTIVTVGITKDGRWLLYSGDIDRIANGDWERDPNNRTAFLTPDPTVKGLLVLQEGGRETVLPIDVVFPVLHGKNGEDGTLQGLLQMNGIPFVGCDLLSSATCMDKASTNILLAAAGVPQAEFLWLYSIDYEKRKEEILREIHGRLKGYPVFVKPANAGSSVGVSKVHEKSELDAAVAKAAQ